MDAETYLTTLIEMRDFLVSVNKRYYMAMPVLGNFVRLIGSFSVVILQYGPFPWKRSKTCIFV